MKRGIDCMHVEIGIVDAAEDREAVFALRMLVFVEEQLVPVEEELDAYDDTAIHFLVRVRGSISDEPGLIVATARLLDKGAGVGKIGRVAVMADYRRLGLGAGLLQYIEAYARAREFLRLELEAQCYAIPFYEKLGYIAAGPIFLDANIEHRYMSMAINPNPLLAEGATAGIYGGPNAPEEG